jgi:hypothetical protein
LTLQFGTLSFSGVKTLIFAAIVVAGWIGHVSSASAQIMIDGFLNNTVNVVAPGSPNSVITNNIDGTEIDRQISVQATETFSIESTVLDGVLIVDASGPGEGSASAEIAYLGFEIDLGDNTFFEFTVGKVVGTPVLALILEDTSATQISGAMELTPTDTTQSFFLDLTQFAGYTPGFASHLNSITVIIGGGEEFFFVEGESFQFTSIPEPSAALLVAAGGLALVWRRRPFGTSPR